MAASVLQKSGTPEVATTKVVEVLMSDHFLNWSLLQEGQTVKGSNGSWICTLQDVSAARVALSFGKMRWRLKKYIVFPIKHRDPPIWTLGILVNYNWIKDIHVSGYPERHLHFRWIHFHIGCLQDDTEVADVGRAYSSFLVDGMDDEVHQVHVPGLPVPADAPGDTGLYLGYYMKTWLTHYEGKLNGLIDLFMHGVSSNGSVTSNLQNSFTGRSTF